MFFLKQKRSRREHSHETRRHSIQQYPYPGALPGAIGDAVDVVVFVVAVVVIVVAVVFAVVVPRLWCACSGNSYNFKQ